MLVYITDILFTGTES